MRNINGEKLVLLVCIDLVYLTVTSSALSLTKSDGGGWGKEVEIVLRDGEK